MPASAIFTRTYSYEFRSDICASISVCRSPGICSEPGREERKPQTGLTIRLRPGEAFARSKNAESVLFAPTDRLWTGPQEGAHAA